jgi:hypothetical protein
MGAPMADDLLFAAALATEKALAELASA